MRVSLDSILRGEEHRELTKLTLDGAVLDLGGEGASGYLTGVPGGRTVTTVNLGSEKGCDVVHDLEQLPLPFGEASYDAVILYNTLEHIYHARELVNDTYRVLRQGGKVVITVPFLFPVHPSPRDYWRFTEDAMRQMLRDAGYSDITCVPLGTGVSIVCYHFFERLLPRPLRFVAFFLRPLARGLDWLLYHVRFRSGQQKREWYTLGYFLIGNKPITHA